MENETVTVGASDLGPKDVKPIDVCGDLKEALAERLQLCQECRDALWSERDENARLTAENDRLRAATDALARLLKTIDAEPLPSKIALSFATFSAVVVAGNALTAIDGAVPEEPTDA